MPLHNNEEVDAYESYTDNYVGAEVTPSGLKFNVLVGGVPITQDEADALWENQKNLPFLHSKLG